jgi:hypothetical protein
MIDAGIANFRILTPPAFVQCRALCAKIVLMYRERILIGFAINNPSA